MLSLCAPIHSEYSELGHETRESLSSLHVDECIFTAAPCGGGILGAQKLIRLTLLFRTHIRAHKAARLLLASFASCHFAVGGVIKDELWLAPGGSFGVIFNSCQLHV